MKHVEKELAIGKSESSWSRAISEGSSCVHFSCSRSSSTFDATITSSSSSPPSLADSSLSSSGSLLYYWLEVSM